jgi:hypothetical protein
MYIPIHTLEAIADAAMAWYEAGQRLQEARGKSDLEVNRAYTQHQFDLLQILEENRRELYRTIKIARGEKIEISTIPIIGFDS